MVYVTKWTVPAATSASLASLGPVKRYLLGDELAVSDSVELTLRIERGDRIGGPGWQSTAAQFAARAKAEGWLPVTRIGFAAKVPDVTGIGAYLGSRGAPLMGVNPTSVPAVTEGYLTAGKEDIRGGYVFGPTSSVSEGVRLKLLNIIK